MRHSDFTSQTKVYIRLSPTSIIGDNKPHHVYLIECSFLRIFSLLFRLVESSCDKKAKRPGISNNYVYQNDVYHSKWPLNYRDIGCEMTHNSYRRNDILKNVDNGDNGDNGDKRTKKIIAVQTISMKNFSNNNHLRAGFK